MDRSKFKSAPMKAIKKQDSDVGQRRGYSTYERPGFHDIESGENIFRIFPAHPSSKEPLFLRPKGTTWLSIEVDTYDDDGEKTGETEVKRRPIFNSHIHGPKALEGKDLVNLYRQYAKDRFEEMFETEDEKKAAVGVMDDFRSGIRPGLGWVMYAKEMKSQKIARLEVSNFTKKKIVELANQADSADDVISTDPFTDPDDGICLIINKKGKGLDTEYSVELHSEKKTKFQIQLIPTPLTDSDLETLETFESLESLYHNAFRRRDFEKQLEGLERFDAEAQFNFFQDEKWLEEVESLRDLVWEHVKENPITGTSSDGAAEEDEGLDEKFKGESKEDEPKEEKKEEPKPEKKKPGPKPKPKQVAKEAPEPEKEQEPEEKEETPEEPKEEKKEEAPVSASDKLAALKAKLGKK